ncbi:kinase-like domain-containing protein [Lineolata rhizophorae]|uniref:Kinase-like domain-containing protein n=1 Tax=Lineolata rhizophorae TaxID=578093 RepID=A0A6A6NKW8_9PEZI|nr:kinase-like domain-containing protein [Lineolata rhizophorae]
MLSPSLRQLQRPKKKSDEEVARKLDEAKTYRALSGGCDYYALAISRIAYIHSKGFLHHNIEPKNFLMGVGKRDNMLYAINFGLAKDRYAGFENYNEREQSWGGDLESLGYVLLYFARVSLPWRGLKVSTGKERNELIKQKKTKFAAYINYTRLLWFKDRPDYACLRQRLRPIFKSHGFKYDNAFD